MIRRSALLVSLLLAACTAANRNPAPTAAPNLPVTRWKSSDAATALDLHPDFNATWIENYKPSPIPGSLEGDSRFGTWACAAQNIALVAFDGEHFFPLVRLYKRGDTYAFDSVARRKGQLDARDYPPEWFEFRPGHWAYARDLAPYSDETPLPGFSQTLPATHDDAFPVDLLATLRRDLPRGWSLTRVADAILVARDAPIRVANTINAPAIDDLPTFADRYTLMIRRAPLGTPSALAAIAAHNKAVETKRVGLRQRLDRLDHKFDSYIPRTDADRALIAEYEALKLTWHYPPTHHIANTHSYYIDDSLLVGQTTSQHDEIARIKKTLLAPFAAYPQ